MTDRADEAAAFRERNRRIFERNLAGTPQTEIARSLGLSPARIRQIVERERARRQQAWDRWLLARSAMPPGRIEDPDDVLQTYKGQWTVSRSRAAEALEERDDA